MKFDKRTREQLRAHCQEFHEDDGVDPRELFEENNDRRKGDRKARQLCRQVAETLELVLPGDCRDEILQSLHVMSVEPAPDSSRLLVVVVADLPAEQFHRAEILARLERQTARLRSEVAAAIARKRVPMLAFEIAGPTPSREACSDSESSKTYRFLDDGSRPANHDRLG
jgi:ribosome-binding factor A